MANVLCINSNGFRKKNSQARDEQLTLLQFIHVLSYALSITGFFKFHLKNLHLKKKCCSQPIEFLSNNRNRRLIRYSIN